MQGLKPIKMSGNSMNYKAINLSEKFDLIKNHWEPKNIAALNDYQFKLAKIEGDFIWHKHDDTDEAFIVVEGELRIDFRDGFVNLSKGEIYVVEKGVEHKPYAEKEVHLMLIEPSGTINTGETESNRTASDTDWI